METHKKYTKRNSDCAGPGVELIYLLPLLLKRHSIVSVLKPCLMPGKEAGIIVVSRLRLQRLFFTLYLHRSFLYYQYQRINRNPSQQQIHQFFSKIHHLLFIFVLNDDHSFLGASVKDSSKLMSVELLDHMLTLYNTLY